MFCEDSNNLLQTTITLIITKFLPQNLSPQILKLEVLKLGANLELTKKIKTETKPGNILIYVLYKYILYI